MNFFKKNGERIYHFIPIGTQKGITPGLGQNRGRVYEIPEESRLVLEIFEMRADGMKRRKIFLPLKELLEI